jgi:hypothetical protein
MSSMPVRTAPPALRRDRRHEQRRDERSTAMAIIDGRLSKRRRRAARGRFFSEIA